MKLLPKISSIALSTSVLFSLTSLDLNAQLLSSGGVNNTPISCAFGLSTPLAQVHTHSVLLTTPFPGQTHCGQVSLRVDGDIPQPQNAGNTCIPANIMEVRRTFSGNPPLNDIMSFVIDAEGFAGFNTDLPKAQMESIGKNRIAVVGEMQQGKINQLYQDYADVEINTEGNNYPYEPASKIGVYGRGIDDDRRGSEGAIVGVYGYSQGWSNELGEGIGVMGFAKGSAYNIGVRGITDVISEVPGGEYYGVQGISDCFSCDGYHVGVYAFADGAATNHALFAETNGTGAMGGSGDFAGYFVGDVYSSTGNYFGPSDRRLKTDINELEDATELIMLLRPKTYQYDVEKYGKYGLSEGQKYGLIAQELKEVFPGMVSSSKLFASNEEKSGTASTDEEYLGVNYTALIPVLIAALQEQQMEIERLQEDLNTASSLNGNGQDLEGQSFKSSLDVNTFTQTDAKITIFPNPANDQVSVRLTDEVKAGKVVIHNNAGSILMESEFTGSEMSLNTQNLSEGVYQVSIFEDGQHLSTETVLIKH